MKGGADVVLALCTRALAARRDRRARRGAARERLRERNEELAASGYRTLAFAMRDARPSRARRGRELERDLTYVGILGLVDPPRAEVAAAIDECHRAGIKVAMVTGDHALTARAIASEIGLLDGDAPTSVVTGAELEAMTDDELVRPRRGRPRLRAREPRAQAPDRRRAQAPTARSSR